MSAMSGTLWTCPLCGVHVPVAHASRIEGARLVVTLTDTALTDVFAHAWTHDTGAGS